jgi:cytochrome b
MAPPRTKTQFNAQPPGLWDPVVRLTHWGIAAAVLVNALVTEGGSLWHVSLGWTAMALLLLRLIWGGLGPKEARLSAFPPNPAAAVRHLRQLVAGKVESHPSHNPAGAMMVYAFWATLAAVILSGLILTGGDTPMKIASDNAAVASGDWSVLIDKDAARISDTEETAFRHTIEEVHDVAANLLLLLAALHVAGVFVESRAMRRNLLAPMLLGQNDRRK